MTDVCIKLTASVPEIEANQEVTNVVVPQKTTRVWLKREQITIICISIDYEIVQIGFVIVNVSNKNAIRKNLYLSKKKTFWRLQEVVSEG